MTQNNTMKTIITEVIKKRPQLMTRSSRTTSPIDANSPHPAALNLSTQLRPSSNRTLPCDTSSNRPSLYATSPRPNPPSTFPTATSLPMPPPSNTSPIPSLPMPSALPFFLPPTVPSQSPNPYSISKLLLLHAPFNFDQFRSSPSTLD